MSKLESNVECRWPINGHKMESFFSEVAGEELRTR